MSSRDVSISISADGEQEFAKAMKNAQSAMKVFSSELKASEAAYQESGDAQEFFAKKSKLLEAQLEQNEVIVQGYKRAVEDMSKAFGDADPRIDKYRIALNKANEAGSKLAKSLLETQREAEEFGRDSTRIGRQMEQGIGEAADDVSDKLDRMARQIESDLGDIGGSVEFSAFKDAADMAVGAFEQLGSFVEGSEDYRRSMSFLEQNAKNAGFEFEYVKGLLFEAASLTGDLDGAFEGISNLLAAGFDGKELTEAIDLIGGAVIRFPETMKFENLAESLQESVSTRSATGAYAELLERLGVNLDDVNKSLEKAKTNEEAQQIALAYLNEHGLEETVDNYKKVNEDLIASEQAQLKYNDAIAGLGEILQPVATNWTKFKTEFLTGTTELINGGFDKWIEDTKTDLEQFRTDINSWMEEMLGEDLYANLFNGEREAGTPGEYAGLVQIGTDQGNAYGSAYGAAAQAAVKQAFESTGDLAAEEGKKAGNDVLESILSEMYADLDTAIESIKQIGANIATTVGNGITDATDNAVSAASNMWESIKAVLSQTISIPKPEFNAETYNGTGRTTASSYAAGGQNNTVTVVTQIDGQTVANATASGVNNVLGAQAQRASTYNR